MFLVFYRVHSSNSIFEKYGYQLTEVTLISDLLILSWNGEVDQIKYQFCNLYFIVNRLNSHIIIFLLWVNICCSVLISFYLGKLHKHAIKCKGGRVYLYLHGINLRNDIWGNLETMLANYIYLERNQYLLAYISAYQSSWTAWVIMFELSKFLRMLTA